MLFSIVMLFHCLMPASRMADKMPKKMNKSELKIPKMLKLLAKFLYKYDL